MYVYLSIGSSFEVTKLQLFKKLFIVKVCPFFCVSFPSNLQVPPSPLQLVHLKGFASHIIPVQVLVLLQYFMHCFNVRHPFPPASSQGIFESGWRRRDCFDLMGLHAN